MSYEGRDEPMNAQKTGGRALRADFVLHNGKAAPRRQAPAANPALTCNSGGRALAAGCDLVPRLYCCIWRGKGGLPRREGTACPSRRHPAWGGAAWDITERVAMFN